MLSANASRREIARSFASITPETVIRGNYPSIVRLKLKKGEEKTEEAIAILINDAALAFGENMDEELLLELAAEVQTQYYYMSLEDCYLVLNRLKRQPLYGKLTLNKILSAFEQYQKERVQKAAEMSYNQHLANKENPNAYSRTLDTIRINKTLKKKRK